MPSVQSAQCYEDTKKTLRPRVALNILKTRSLGFTEPVAKRREKLALLVPLRILLVPLLLRMSGIRVFGVKGYFLRAF